MERRIITIALKQRKSNSEEDLNITLPSSLYKKVSNRLGVRLKVGLKEVKVRCHGNHSKDVLELPNTLIDDFGLVRNQKINMIIKHNTICLGPVIGIFVSNAVIKKAKAQEASFRSVEMMKANIKAKTILYYFSVKDVNFEEKRVKGTYFDFNTERWEKKYFPYPDILYDRGGGVAEIERNKAKYIKEELEREGALKRINSKCYFDKGELYEKLASYEQLEEFLPQTIQYGNLWDLEESFKKSSVIFLKDCLGTNGFGVVRIIKYSDREYELSYYYNRTIKYNLSSISEVAEKVEAIFKGKKVIIQRGIDLLEVNNRKVDIIGTIQRDGKGMANIVAITVRVGKEGCPINSVRTDSSVYRVEEFYKEFFNYSSKQIEEVNNIINTFLLGTFKYIEAVYGEFGELDIDFAIDTQGRMWIIECNGKPNKDALHLAYDENTINQAFLNPLEYGKYLWGN